MMKTLLLFVVESAQSSFDREILEKIDEEQKKHRMQYRTDRVRVRAGSENRLSLDDLSWDVCVDESSSIKDIAEAKDAVSKLVTKLYSRMGGSTDGCELVFFGSGDRKTELVALHIGQLVTTTLREMTAVNAHVVLFQDQIVHRDPDTIRLIDMIRRLNQEKNHVFSSICMLPWEPDARAATRRTASMLVKTVVMKGGKAMGMAGGTYGKEWIETAAVTRLTPPVQQITHKVFRYLADDFNRNVLESALRGADDMALETNDLKDCVQDIKTRILELERRNDLPRLEDLFMIMPAKNPGALISEKDEIPVTTAWDRIYSIYGEYAGKELYDRMYPNMNNLIAEYEEKKAEITVLLLRKVLEVGTKRSLHGAGCGFEYLPDIIENIKQQVLKKLKTSGMPEAENERFVHAIMPGKKAIVGHARTRHILLRTVYRDACSRYEKQKADLREAMFKEAAEAAKIYLSDCIIELKKQFDQRCSMRDASQPMQEYFSYRMDDAYSFWCNRKLTDKVGLLELYNCFTEEVCHKSYLEAAKEICDQMEKMIDDRTFAATNLIKARINNFFSELKYRAELLQDCDGKTVDLNTELLEHLKKQLEKAPLMLAINAALKPDSRMFIFHQSADAQAFAQLIAADNEGTNILDDPFEDGVMMIVKYTGNALDKTVVAINNSSADGEAERAE